MALELHLERLDGGETALGLEDPILVIAGFTGRSSEVVRRHICELEAQGIAAPPDVPALYSLPGWLLSAHGGPLQVLGSSTSGEAEPVLIRDRAGSLFVTVGSDHTDRDLEKTSITVSKLVCPKPLARTAWPLEEVLPHWDRIRVRSWADRRAYQDEALAALAPPLELLAEVDARLQPNRERALVLFLGTVPLMGDGFCLDADFHATLEDESLGRSIVCRYVVEDVSRDPIAA